MRHLGRPCSITLTVLLVLSLSSACDSGSDGSSSTHKGAQELPTGDIGVRTPDSVVGASDAFSSSSPDAAIATPSDVATATLLDWGGGGDTPGPNPDSTTPGPVPADPPVDPFGSGEHTVTIYETTVSGANGKSFEAILAVPDGTESRPAVVFLPGFMLSGSQFLSSADALARHSFITLLPSFGDSILGAIDHVDLAGHTSAMLDWLQLESATPDSPIYGRVDVDSLATAGHSRGGKIALLTAVQDARVAAVYTFDPVDAVGGPGASGPTPANPSVTPELMGDLTVPVGFFGAGLGAEGLSPCAPTEENHAAYFQHADAAEVAYHHVDANAGHMDFTDDGGGLTGAFCAAGDDPQGTRAAAIGTMVAFFRAHLSNEDGYTPWLQGDLVAEGLSWETK